MYTLKCTSRELSIWKILHSLLQNLVFRNCLIYYIKLVPFNTSLEVFKQFYYWQKQPIYVHQYHSSVVSSRLPSCGPGFKSQAHHLCFFQFVLLKLWWEKDKNKQKEAGIGPFLKIKINRLAPFISQCSRLLGLHSPVTFITKQWEVNLRPPFNGEGYWSPYFVYKWQKVLHPHNDPGI